MWDVSSSRSTNCTPISCLRNPRRLLHATWPDKANEYCEARRRTSKVPWCGRLHSTRIPPVERSNTGPKLHSNDSWVNRPVVRRSSPRLRRPFTPRCGSSKKCSFALSTDCDSAFSAFSGVSKCLGFELTWYYLVASRSCSLCQVQIRAVVEGRAATDEFGEFYAGFYETHSYLMLAKT